MASGGQSTLSAQHLHKVSKTQEHGHVSRPVLATGEQPVNKPCLVDRAGIHSGLALEVQCGDEVHDWNLQAGKQSHATSQRTPKRATSFHHSKAYHDPAAAAEEGTPYR